MFPQCFTGGWTDAIQWVLEDPARESLKPKPKTKEWLPDQYSIPRLSDWLGSLRHMLTYLFTAPID